MSAIRIIFRLVSGSVSCTEPILIALSSELIIVRFYTRTAELSYESSLKALIQIRYTACVSFVINLLFSKYRFLTIVTR